MMIVAMIEITLVSLSGILKYSVFVEGYRFLKLPTASWKSYIK